MIACSECGALVDPDFMDIHLHWHAALNMVMERYVAELFGETEDSLTMQSVKACIEQNIVRDSDGEQG